MVHSSRIRVVFYRTASGREPVREWLLNIDRESRRIIGEDIKTVQFGWPLAMPLVRSLGKGLWEIRSKIDRRHARVLFSFESGLIVLLHAFFKKSRQTPDGELAIARRRQRLLQDEKR